MPSEPHSYDQLIVRTLQVVRDAIALYEPESDGRTGGVFVHLYIDSGVPLGQIVPLTVTRVGALAPDKAKEKEVYAREKAFRLLYHPEHLASQESRDPDKEQWTGAIRAGNHIFSISGFPELVDEAIVLYAAIYSGMLSKDNAHAIAQKTGNTIFALPFLGI
jgi:hypothetical protein